MKKKGIITSAQDVVAAGKSAAEGAKALAGEVAHAAATAATAAADVVLDRVADKVAGPTQRTFPARLLKRNEFNARDEPRT
jgi:hypothetical protein